MCFLQHFILDMFYENVQSNHQHLHNKFYTSIIFNIHGIQENYALIVLSRVKSIMRPVAYLFLKKRIALTFLFVLTTVGRIKPFLSLRWTADRSSSITNLPYYYTMKFNMLQKVIIRSFFCFYRYFKTDRTY